MDVRFEWATLALTTFLENELVAASTGLSSAHMGHLERFRSVLHTFYVNSFGYWPPNSMDSRGGSFSRAIYRSMYFEFRNLYEYLVDTQATSDPTKPTMGASSFNVLHNIDAFDAKQKFSSLPNPSPLLPGIPEALLQPQVRQKGAIARLRQFESKSAKSDRRQATLRALRDATNNDKSQVMECALVHVYQDFETQCTTKDEDKISAADGRALRWLLVYGIFQTLISVIRAPREVRHTEGVDYMLCVQTAGTPPWKDLPSAALPPSSRDNLGQEERGRSRDRVDRPVQAMFVEPKVIPTDKTKGPKQTRPRHTAIFVNGYGDGARKYSNDVSPNSSRTTTMTSSTSVSKLSVTHSPHDSGVAPKIPVRSPLHRHVVPSESNIVQSTQMPPASTEVDGSPGPENPLGSHPTSRSSLSLRRQSLQMNADPQTPPIPQLRVDTTPRRGAAPRELELVSRSVPAITVIPRGAPAQEKRSAPVKTREVPTTPRSKESRPQARTHSDTIGSFKSDGTGSSYYDEDEGKREFTAASSAYSLHDGSRDGGYDALSYSAIASVPSIPREIPREALRFTDHTAANTSVPRHQDPSPLAFATQYHDDNLYEVPRVTGRDQQTSAEKAYQDHSRQINAAFAKKRSQPSMNGGNHAKSGSPTVSPGTAFIANPFDSTSANAFVSQQAKHHGMGAQILSNVITPTLIHNTPIASPVIPTHGNLLRTAGRPPSMLGPLPAWSPPSSWQTTAGGSRLPEGMRFPSPSPPLASAARRENPLAAAGKAIASTGGRTDPRPRANTTSAATTAAEGKASYARTGSKPVDAPQVPQLQQRPKKKKSSAGGGGGGGIGGTSKVEMQMALDGPRWSPELQKLMADRSTEDRGRTRHREPYIRVGDVEDEETLGAPEVPMRKIRRAAVGVGR